MVEFVAQWKWQTNMKNFLAGKFFSRFSCWPCHAIPLPNWQSGWPKQKTGSIPALSLAKSWCGWLPPLHPFNPPLGLGPLAKTRLGQRQRLQIQLPSRVGPFLWFVFCFWFGFGFGFEFFPYFFWRGLVLGSKLECRVQISGWKAAAALHLAGCLWTLIDILSIIWCLICASHSNVDFSSAPLFSHWIFWLRQLCSCQVFFSHFYFCVFRGATALCLRSFFSMLFL